MFHDFHYPAILAASSRAEWRIDDVIDARSELDFTRRFLPEGFARTGELDMLSEREKLLLNQIRGHDYLCLFGVVEEFILPFLMDHIRASMPKGDEVRIRALLQFATEEAKHIELFRRFRRTFERGFGHPCELIGPPEAIAEVVLGHPSLSVALLILMLEWMTQAHYVDSVRGRAELDPLFADLLRCHWIEEAQHARLDTLIVEAIAAPLSDEEIHGAVNGLMALIGFFDMGLAKQSELNLEALERAIGRSLSGADRARLIAQQHQALRWTFLGSGLVHKQFRATLGGLSKAELKHIDALAPKFC